MQPNQCCPNLKISYWCQIVKKAGGTLWISRPGKFRWDYSGP
ncbi:MAG: outer-membrane lipoprotein carrier protein LolA, partial [Runella zeae]